MCVINTLGKSIWQIKSKLTRNKSFWLPVLPVTVQIDGYVWRLYMHSIYAKFCLINIDDNSILATVLSNVYTHNYKYFQKACRSVSFNSCMYAYASHDAICYQDDFSYLLSFGSFWTSDMCTNNRCHRHYFLTDTIILWVFSTFSFSQIPR